MRMVQETPGAGARQRLSVELILAKFSTEEKKERRCKWGMFPTKWLERINSRIHNVLQHVCDRMWKRLHCRKTVDPHGNTHSRTHRITQTEMQGLWRVKLAKTAATWANCSLCHDLFSEWVFNFVLTACKLVSKPTELASLVWEQKTQKLVTDQKPKTVASSVKIQHLLVKPELCARKLSR